MITHEGQVAYLILIEPSKKDLYFEIIDKLGYIKNIEQVIDASNEPVVIIDKSLLSEKQFNYLNVSFQVILGAKIITKSL